MRVIDIFGAFLMGALVIAGLSLIVKPGSAFGQGVGAVGNSITSIIGAAKQ